jgi:CubicO group peptidase (beta-lactamase class C family)
MNRLLLCVALLLLAPAADPLPRATPESLGLSSERLDQASVLLKRFVAEGKIAGAVAAVARKGKLAYLEAAGLQDLQTQTPMSDRSLFRIYSMTKPITAVAVMMLHEEGRFQLSDPVSKYMPEFSEVQVLAPDGTPRSPSRPITIRDLLLHTSGLNHRTSQQYRRAEVRSRSIDMGQFIRNIVGVPLMEDPGVRHRYSESTTVLGGLVEIWSGKPFDAFLNERLFKPLGMNDTMFWVTGPDRPRLTTVYGPSPTGLTPVEIESVPFTERPALIEGAVGLVSTVPDYLRFSQMLLNRGELDGVRILRAATVETMTANGLSGPEAQSGTMGWGLANVSVDLRTGEYGWDGTAGTIFWINPEKELITILMTQSSPANPDGLRQEFKRVIDQALK